MRVGTVKWHIGGYSFEECNTKTERAIRIHACRNAYDGADLVDGFRRGGGGNTCGCDGIQ